MAKIDIDPDNKKFLDSKIIFKEVDEVVDHETTVPAPGTDPTSAVDGTGDEVDIPSTGGDTYYWVVVALVAVSAVAVVVFRKKEKN